VVFCSGPCEPFYPDTMSALMTRLINGYNRSVTPPARPLPHARPGARAEWMMATAASFLKGEVMPHPAARGSVPSGLLRGLTCEAGVRG
jgi:hypothetical protein